MLKDTQDSHLGSLNLHGCYEMREGGKKRRRKGEREKKRDRQTRTKADTEGRHTYTLTHTEFR